MITGFDTGCPILKYPYPNLTTATGPVDTFTQTGCSNPTTDGNLETATYDGNSDYNSLELALRHRMSHGLSFNLGYTYAHSLANFTDHLTAGLYPQNSYDYAAEMGNSILDIRSRFVGSFLWDLPFGQGKAYMNRANFAGRWLGGWQFNGIVTEQTGNPFQVTASNDGLVDGHNSLYADCLGVPSRARRPTTNCIQPRAFISIRRRLRSPVPDSSGPVLPIPITVPESRCGT